jgi:hypothetical protein
MTILSSSARRCPPEFEEAALGQPPHQEIDFLCDLHLGNEPRRDLC